MREWFAHFLWLRVLTRRTVESFLESGSARKPPEGRGVRQQKCIPAAPVAGRVLFESNRRDGLGNDRGFDGGEMRRASVNDDDSIIVAVKVQLLTKPPLPVCAEARRGGASGFGNWTQPNCCPTRRPPSLPIVASRPHFAPSSVWSPLIDGLVRTTTRERNPPRLSGVRR